MKLDDSIIDQFNLEPEDDREPVNVMRVSELLDFLKESATRIVSKSQQYFSTEDADIQAVAELMLNMFQMLLDVWMRQNGKLAVTNICQDHTE